MDRVPDLGRQCHDDNALVGGLRCLLLCLQQQDATGPNAALLLEFICSVYPAPNWGALGTDPGLAGHRYSELVLVGHSEGAVLIRMAILRRAQELGIGGSELDERVSGISEAKT